MAEHEGASGNIGIRRPGTASYASPTRQPVKLDPNAPDPIALARQESSGTQHGFGSTPTQRAGMDPNYIPGYGRIAAANGRSGLTPEASWDKMFPSTHMANYAANAQPTPQANPEGATGAAGVATPAPQSVPAPAPIASAIPPLVAPSANMQAQGNPLITSDPRLNATGDPNSPAARATAAAAGTGRKVYTPYGTASSSQMNPYA